MKTIRLTKATLCGISASNAALSTAPLNAKIDAYDILGQISNVTATVNSLGNTETWTNSMSRYVLLSLAWRFTIMPKK